MQCAVFQKSLLTKLIVFITILKGGGYMKKQNLYDTILLHRLGWKNMEISKTLKLSETQIELIITEYKNFNNTEKELTEDFINEIAKVLIPNDDTKIVIRPSLELNIHELIRIFKM